VTGLEFRQQYLKGLANAFVAGGMSPATYAHRSKDAFKHMRSKYMPHQGKKEVEKRRDAR
jgi:hypothetical protein